ncbi:helix-turn-helix transcriptional regulator [Vibrio alfacsensis]|uniref:helix-turn-helix transcriptional regulator n=1 Tax=Vibrio alfacsensis TaxID=1074311 RepID=UPI002ADD5BB7|nr:helix-turn-helix transcriptional regulator [Vibrio alfacsensis]WQE78955.1 helix-turn-helix transcriptional regulator [Vibrio alfacsensis]
MNIPVNTIEQSLLRQLPGCWGCKDKESVFRYVNQEYAELMGHSSPDECIGKTDFEMLSPTIECAQEFQRQDQHVIETGESLKILDIHPYPDGHWRAHIFTKTPWRDDTGNVLGTIFYGRELTDTAVIEVGYWVCRAIGVNPNKQSIFRFSNVKPEPDKLTCREQETLFLLLYGKKPQFIAQAMGISTKTVEGHVARLRAKFEANSKNELIDKAMEAGYGSIVPRSLLKHQLSVVLNGER